MPRPKRHPSTVSIHLRIPADLYERISQAAYGNSPRTSINYEIEDRLLNSFKAADTLHEQLADLRSRIAQLEAEKIQSADAAPVVARVRAPTPRARTPKERV